MTIEDILKSLEREEAFQREVLASIHNPDLAMFSHSFSKVLLKESQEHVKTIKLALELLDTEKKT